MAETTVTVTDPEFVTTKRVDSSGRLYLGKEYAGGHVRVIVERVEEDDDDE